jgi:hypothetical protein
VQLPNFLFIGADKAGSTWLFRVLQKHPQCFVPPCKDIYFFDRFYSRGLRWYTSFFQTVPPSARAVGELSHDYLYSDKAADRIASTLPGVKLLVFLRHPVERAFSEYLYLVRSGLARPNKLRETLSANSDPIEHSRYAQHLPRYIDRFPTDQIGIFEYEDLSTDPVAFAAAIYSFLGVDHADTIDYHERVLPAARPRSTVLARGAKVGATLTRTAGFPGIVGRVKSSRLTRTLYAPYTEQNRPTLQPEDRQWLHAKLDPDVVELESLLGRSFSRWKQTSPPSAT